MKPNMDFIIYIDNIKEEIINHIILIEEYENKPKKIFKKNNKDSYKEIFFNEKIYYDNSFLEINTLIDIDILYEPKVLENLAKNKKAELNNKGVNNAIKKLIKNSKDLYWLYNNKSSCAIDSFLTIFSNNLYLYLIKIDYKNDIFLLTVIISYYLNIIYNLLNIY